MAKDDKEYMGENLAIIKYESQNDFFSKSNSLISSKYKATLLEQKLLNIVLARLQQRNYVDMGPNVGLVCQIHAKELKDMMNLSGGGLYAQLKPAAAAMTSRAIGFENDETQEFKYIALFTSVEYKDGILTAKFNYELKQYLNPRTQFTMLELPILLQYRSVYSLRLHEMLLSKCYTRKKHGVLKYSERSGDGKHFKIEMSVSELKLSLGVVNADSPAVKRILSDSKRPDYDKAIEKASEQSFKEWAEFRRKVIDVAINEINKVDNGMEVSYEAMKGGRGAKVYAIVFYVTMSSKEDQHDEAGNIKKIDESQNGLSENEQFAVQAQVWNLIKEKLDLKDIRAICEAADYDYGRIQTAYGIACESGQINNLTGFMLAAIKNGYSKPVKKKGAKRNSFNNFEQRDYDFDALEKELLNS